MPIPGHIGSLTRTLAGLGACWLLGSVTMAAPAPAPAAPPSAADPVAVEFLLAAATKDFKASGSARPTAIRNARIGILHDASKGNYMLCGAFKSGTGAAAKWTPFATIKTSDYEQWIGGAAQAYCGAANIQWFVGEHSATLMKRLGG